MRPWGIGGGGTVLPCVSRPLAMLLQLLLPPLRRCRRPMPLGLFSPLHNVAAKGQVAGAFFFCIIVTAAQVVVAKTATYAMTEPLSLAWDRGLAERIHLSMLRSMHHFPLPDSRGHARVWHTVCAGNGDATGGVGGDLCDSYGAGDGFCLVQAVDGTDEAQPSAALLSSNCRVSLIENLEGAGAGQFAGAAVATDARRAHRQQASAPAEGATPTQAPSASIVKAQLLHCPRNVPVALLTIPKCGTTSTINWALQMDAEEHTSLVRGARTFIEHGLTQFLEDWLITQLRSAVGYGLNVSDEIFLNQLVFRSMHRLSSRTFLPPAHLCPTCCLYGRGRQFVVVARNPYVRLLSYFRFGVLHRAGIVWRSWIHFGAWLTFVFGHRGRFPGRFANDLDWVKPEKSACSVNESGWMFCESFTEQQGLSSSDISHVRPLSDMVRDRRFLSGTSALDSGDAHVIHLETYASDISRLEALLCRRFANCRPLPEFPNVLPGNSRLEEVQARERCHLNLSTLAWRNCSAPPWVELWTPQLVKIVVKAFSDDFRWLGYSIDPKSPMPLNAAKRRAKRRSS
eukprot:TRINITY_DN38089_c0_g1_i2.p1 TRINITY_DN38089_c0_g1~~TRINITY_DN38089_c0_g1_i2.p1  ORF type:complete len:569 (+),score=69.18 TRINITY_DN38089_c0_g1_i2:211-1917(+)